MLKANLYDANLQGAWLWYAKLQGAHLLIHTAKYQKTLHFLSSANLQGVQSQENWLDYRNVIKKAVKEDTDLKTDISGIRCYDDFGDELDLDDDEKKNGFASMDPMYMTFPQTKCRNCSKI